MKIRRITTLEKIRRIDTLVEYYVQYSEEDLDILASKEVTRACLSDHPEVRRDVSHRLKAIRLARIDKLSDLAVVFYSE